MIRRCINLWLLLLLLWPPCVADADIIYGRPMEWGRPLYFCPVFCSSLLFFSLPNLSRRRSDVCHTETFCTRLAENIGRKNSPKITIWAPSHILSGYIFAIKACIDNRKKSLLSSNIHSTSPHNIVNFGLLTAEIC